MTTETLATAGILSLLIALVYAYAGKRLMEHPLAGEGGFALTLFGVWWFALAGSTLLSSTETFLAVAGTASISLIILLEYLRLLLLCAGMLGLAYYLIYLFTGKSGTLPYIAGFYVLLFLGLVWIISTAGLNGLEIQTWSVSPTYETPLQGTTTQLLLTLLIGPPLLGAFAYLSLLSRVDDATQRYRITLVGTSIMLWFGSAYGASLIGLSDASWWGLVSQFIGLAAALTILAAYLPPGWIQDRFDVVALQDQPTPQSDTLEGTWDTLHPETADDRFALLI